MPRIDPLDLLNCLGVLLSSNGGIKGPVEVVRVARLMLRFSKKLVSKCIYIHVLKATPSALLDQFLNEQGAYFLLLKWLIEALQTRNTPLLAEMLELVQLLPMSDVRLKDQEVIGLIRSCLPYEDLGQMMQSIAQDYADQNCRNLATQIWTRWFATKPDEYSLAQEGILPDDMDLSIYAPDASSAAYGDPLGSINLGEEVGMAMSNLSTLDMNSCAPYMENNDYYNLNHFEPVPTLSNNNMSQDNHQVFTMEANYSNEPLQQQQHPMQVLNPPTVEVNNSILPNSAPSEWPANPLMAIPPVQESAVIDETKTPETTTGLPVLKIKVKGGTYVVNNQVAVDPEPPAVVDAESNKEKVKEKVKEKRKDKEKEKEKDKKSSSSSKLKEGSSSSSSKSSDLKKRDKEKDRLKSSKERSSSASSSSSSKDKSRSSKEDANRSKDRSKTAKSSPRASDIQSKEAKQAEKNLETLAKIKAMTPSVKLAKIPRKKVEEAPSNETAAAAATADMLDKLTPRPKTVKTFNSKFRSTGLVDEPAAKSPPVAKKVSTASPVDQKKSPSVKRSGSMDGLTPPADKKLKAVVDDTAISAAVAAVMKKTATDVKPAVKLISPRPRPLLQDSSLFMDALEAGSKATTEPRKRKRSAKDSPSDVTSAPPAKVQEPPAQPAVSSAVSANSEPAVAVSPVPVKPMFNFYQDTLETDGATVKEEEKVDDASTDVKTGAPPDSPSKLEPKIDDGEDKDEGSSRDSSKTDMADDSQSPVTEQSDSGKPKGVLVIHASQRRRPKKCVQWRSEEDLEMHHYFELDETERVNVNKLLFVEMKQAEREREKQAFQMSKTMVEEPEVEEQLWKGLVPIDLPEDRVNYGENSQEKQIQATRESCTLQALYFKGQVLPDTPIEADPEVPLERTDSAPTVIPLDDVTGNPESVYDHRHLPWPEPKLFGAPAPHHNHPPSHLQPLPPLQQQQQQQQQQQPPYAPMYGRNLPVDPYYPDRVGVPPMDHFGDVGHHGPPMQPMHHHPANRGPPGPANPRDVVGGGTWMAGDGSVYPDHDVPRYSDGLGPQHHHPRDGPGHHRDGPPHRDGHHHHHPDGFHHRERDHPRDRGHGYNDGMGGPGPGSGYLGPPRGGLNMDGPRPRFHGPPRGGSGGRGGGSGPSNQPCWHFMRGFCRLENRCKFLHPSN